MSDIDVELAQAVILEHYRSRKGEGCCEGEGATSADGENPLCGDQVTLSLELADGAVVCARFAGQGCAVSQAAASLVATTLEGMEVGQARELLEASIDGLAGKGTGSIDADRMGKLAFLQVLEGNPARARCASIAGELALSLLGEA